MTEIGHNPGRTISKVLRRLADAHPQRSVVRADWLIRWPAAARRSADRWAAGGLMLVHYVSDLVRVHTGDDGTTVRCYLSV